MPNDEAAIGHWSGAGAAVRMRGSELLVIDLDVHVEVVRDKMLAWLTERHPDFMTQGLRRHSGAISIALIGRTVTAKGTQKTARYLGEGTAPKGDFVEVFTGNSKRYVGVAGRHSEGREYDYHGRHITGTPVDALPWLADSAIAPMLAAFHAALRQLRELGPVSLACVHGACLGGGLELALCCDLVLASDDATFGLPEIKLGCYPPVAAALLPRWLGRPRALELLLTGKSFGAADAERLGLLTRRVPAGSLDAACGELTAALLAQSGVALRLAKRAARAGEELPFSAALDQAERIYLDDLVPSADMNEGIAAFLEKRKPQWRHR
jgi:cyclohexa-1,5-dienecarbonyl-CoA hydratase